VLDQVSTLLGPGQPVACAVPLHMLAPPVAPPEEIAASVCVRIAGYWHGSLIEGPGRRTAVKFQSCPLRCHGCITPDSWAAGGGALVPVGRLAAALLDPAHARDGVTVAGGEPFAQPAGLASLLRALKARGVHTLVYSGYTLEALARRPEPEVGEALELADVLIDGPFVAALAEGAGPWSGSANQRMLDLPASRQLGRVVHWRASSAAGPGRRAAREPGQRGGQHVEAA
jgi:anaerobic ribonucleoside-triphosphate reductase activating protein